MNRSIYALFAALFILVLLQSFDRAGDAKRRRDGTDPGYTGSPGDSFRNCTVCHGGTAVEVSGWIRSDIPKEGYKPGMTYRITATNYEIGATRFGFSISPQNPEGDLLGEMIITDTVKTKLIGGGKYITYRSGGVDGQDSLRWEFDWKAPADSVNTVVFYGAFNSNHDGHKDGDHTYLDQHWVFREGYLASLEKTQTGRLNVFPNPAAGRIQLEFPEGMTGEAVLQLQDMQGRVVYQSRGEWQRWRSIDLNHVPAGIYMLTVRSPGYTASAKVVVTR